MPTAVRRWGSISLLSGLGGTIVAAAVIWIYGQAINIPHIARSIDTLADVMTKNHDANEAQFNALAVIIYDHSNQIGMTNVRLQHVEKLSDAQQDDINAVKNKMHHNSNGGH